MNERAILKVEMLIWMCEEPTTGGIAGVIGMASFSFEVSRTHQGSQQQVEARWVYLRKKISKRDLEH